MAANSPVEYYLILKKNDNEIIAHEELPDIKDMVSALMSTTNDDNAIFKLAPNKQGYIFDFDIKADETALAFKNSHLHCVFAVSREKPENASLYLRVRVNSDNICEHISIVTKEGKESADYRVLDVSSSKLKGRLKDTFQRSNYKQKKVLQQVQIFPTDRGMWASDKDFQEKSAEQKENSAEQKEKLENLSKQATEATEAAKAVEAELKRNEEELAELKQKLEQLAEKVKQTEQTARTTLAEEEKSAEQEQDLQAAEATRAADVAKADLVLEQRKFAALKQKQEKLAAQAAQTRQTAITLHAKLELNLEKSAKQEHNITAILKALPPMNTVNGDLILGNMKDPLPGNPEVQSFITISYLEQPSRKVIGITLHQPGIDDIVFNTDDLDIINSCDNPQQQIALLINARIIATPISTMAEAYHFHMKDQSSTQFAYSDGFIVDRKGDVSSPYNFLINLKTKELRIHCKATNKHVIITDFNIDANLTVLIRQFHTAFSSLLGEATLQDSLIALNFLIYICKEVISSRKKSKEEMFAQEVQRLQSKRVDSGAGAELFKLHEQILTPLKALAAKMTRLRNVQPLNQDRTINFELILLLDEIASDIEEIDISVETQSATVNPILKMRDTLLQIYIEDIFSTIKNMTSDNDDTLKQRLTKITEALANLVKLEKINGYTAVFVSALPRPQERNIVYFIPEGEKIRFFVVDPDTNSPITSLLNRPSNQAERDSLLMRTLERLSKDSYLPYEAVTHTIIRQNINDLINLLWGYTLHPISELPARNTEKGNKIYIDKQFRRYVVHLEDGSVVDKEFVFNEKNEKIDSPEFNNEINLDDSIAVLKFVANRMSNQVDSDIIIRSGAVIKESIVSAFGQIAVYSPKESSLISAISAPKSEESSSPSAESSAPSSESSSSGATNTSLLSAVSRSILDKIRDEYDSNIIKITTPKAEDVAESHETLKAFLTEFLRTLQSMLTQTENDQTAALIGKWIDSSQLLFPNSNIIHSQLIADMIEISKKIFSPEAKASIRTVIKLLEINQEQKITILTTPNNDDVSLDGEYLSRFLVGFNALLTPAEQKAIGELIEEIKKLDYLLPESSMIHPKIITTMITIRDKTASPTANAAICSVIEHLIAHQESVAKKKDTDEYTFSTRVDAFSRFLNGLVDKIARLEYKRRETNELSDDISAKIEILKKWIDAYSKFMAANKWYLFGKINLDLEEKFASILGKIREQLTTINEIIASRNKLFNAAAYTLRKLDFMEGINALILELDTLSQPLKKIPLRTKYSSVRDAMIPEEGNAPSASSSSSAPSSNTLPASTRPLSTLDQARNRAPAPPRPGTGIFFPVNALTDEPASSLLPRPTSASQPSLSEALPPSAPKTDTLVEPEASISPDTEATVHVDDKEKGANQTLLIPALPPRPTSSSSEINHQSKDTPLGEASPAPVLIADTLVVEPEADRENGVDKRLSTPSLPPRPTTPSSSEISHQSKDTPLGETSPNPALIANTLIVESEALILPNKEDTVHVDDKEKGKEEEGEDDKSTSPKANLATSPHILLASPRSTVGDRSKGITEESELPASVSVPVTPPSSPQSLRS